MKDKLFFALFLLATNSLDAQQLCKEVNNIAGIERAAHAKLLNKDLSSLTQASGNYNVTYYKCEWNIDPANYYISGKVTPYFIITAPTDNIVFDLSTALKVDSVIVRKRKLSFSQGSDETLTIQLPKAYRKGKRDSVAIYYRGVPVGSGFGSFIQSQHNGVPVLWTLSEPYGARDWWPCRNGLDDKADSIDIYVTHPNQYKTSSNGVLISTIPNGTNITTHYKHRYPIASYLVAISVTNFNVFTDNVQLGNISLPVISYVYPEDSVYFHNNTHLMLDAMRLYNQRFVPYAFMNERYGQTEFGWGGGMEHQTNSFITSPGENLMAHELSHQWFGDRVTCGSWEDIWLNEGFATFCADFLYTETYHPDQLAESVKNNLDYIVSEPEGSVKVDDTTSVGRIFDSRLSYSKGAFLLRMLRWTLGDTNFFKAIHNYLNDPKLRYGFARTSDLKIKLEAVSGKDLTYFFDQWFAGQGYPSFTVNWSQDAANKASINISQTTSNSSVSFYKVPLALRFKNATQTKTIVVDHTTNNQSLVADIGFKADSVFIDPDMELISKNNVSIKTMLSQPAPALTPLLVSPNPFTNTINFSLPDSGNKKVLIRLFDMYGHLVLTKSVVTITANQKYSIDVPAFAKPGIYMLYITVDGKSTSHLVIKE
ncbi:T9SS type A sorting domain-containing protein [Panacibacter ginsenosidivorans]|uniref:Aminopeptidase N n=1 Tax=Panacibacter ginsenosidivorans TaxID=1813871 RepID=A0A5B8VAB4_9BACT|nr:M1 family aminopeptidase [Panacibacter ginsenosidivorans]QEC68065.1 T9SS type A sorting domain-containing protein [Panacibacter ginsenosidivorans]